MWSLPQAQENTRCIDCMGSAKRASTAERQRLRGRFDAGPYDYSYRRIKSLRYQEDARVALATSKLMEFRQTPLHSANHRCAKGKKTHVQPWRPANGGLDPANGTMAYISN